MYIAILIAANFIYVGLMGYLLFRGLRIGLFGSGYPLLAGRESFGWGARVAGFLLTIPLPLAIGIWLALFTSGRITMAEIERGDHNALAMALMAVVILGCFGLSYLFAEVTHTPYWLYLKKTEVPEEEEKEDLSHNEKKRRQRKLEKKLDQARQREEEKRRQLEEEQERLKRRHEQARARKAPPPLPDEDDDYRRGPPRGP